jgi:hypothetical protein
MSRKDYLAIAAILREATLTPKQRDELTARFVTVLADNNARFSPSRFRAAVCDSD